MKPSLERACLWRVGKSFRSRLCFGEGVGASVRAVMGLGVWRIKSVRRGFRTCKVQKFRTSVCLIEGVHVFKSIVDAFASI